MTTTATALSLTLPDPQVARRSHRGPAPDAGLLVVLATTARTTPYTFGRGAVILAVALFGSRKRL